MNRRNTHSLHGIVWLLIVMILVSSLASPAMAGVSLSLGYRGSLIEGSSLTITWNELDDIDHYEFSFRDLTTDSLLYDHKDVGTNTEFRIKKDLIANHSYRAWVGAIAIDSNPADIPGSHQNTMTLSIKPEVCEHNGEPYKANVQKNCKSISDSEHQVTMTYDLRCPDCDDVLESNQVSEEIEPHFPDSNGDCSLCNYKYSCSHSKKDVVIENSAYRPEDENVHIRFKTGHYICANANCGKEIEPYYYEEEEEHSFKNNTCEYCGYTKAKSLSVTAARRQQSACVGESISAAATVKGGSGSFDYLWKVFCNDELVDKTDYSMSANYNYVATKAGNWQFRVYVRDNVLNEEASAITSSIAVSEGACSHTKQKNKTIDTGYNKASDTKHEIITYYDVICEDCGYVLSEGNYFSEIEDHIIDASGRCVCGYAASTATCAHSDSKSEQLGSSRIEQYDEKWHKLIITYQDVCANPNCGIVLVSSREESEMVAHSYDENGQCVCGYLLPNEDCDHAPAKTELNPKYIAVDASCHHFIVTYHYECACGQLNYDENAQSFDSHIFKGRICKLCGFENPCDHADFQNVISSVVEDDKNSDTTHFVVTTYAKTCECGAINPTPIVRTTVQCNFTKNAGIQTEHESQGHQYFDRCACGNANVNGNFKNYLSSCKTCQEQSEEYKLIKELQTLLNNSGYNAGAIDGLWGPNTKNAMNKFRADVMGLGAIDYVDTATMQALRNNVKPDDQPIEQPGSTNPACKHDWFIKDDSGYAKHPHTVIFACKLCTETKSENTTKLLCCACGNGEHVWISTHPAISHKHPMVYKCSKCDKILTEAPAYDAKCIACNPNNYQWPETSTSRNLKQNMAAGEDYIAIRETDEFRDEYLYAPNGGVWESDITHFANGVGTGLSENTGVKSAVYKAVYISPEETKVLSVYMRQMQQIIANDTLQAWTLGLLDDLNMLDGDMKSLTTGGDMVEDKVIEVLMESGYANSEVPLERLEELESMMALTPLDLPGVDAVLNTRDLTGWDLPDNKGGKVLDVIEAAWKWYDFVSTINYTYLTPIIENAAQNGNGLVYEYTVNFDSPIEMEWISGKYTPTNNYAIAPSLGEWVGVDTDDDGVKEWYMSSKYELYGTYEANPY